MFMSEVYTDVFGSIGGRASARYEARMQRRFNRQCVLKRDNVYPQNQIDKALRRVLYELVEGKLPPGEVLEHRDDSLEVLEYSLRRTLKLSLVLFVCAKS